MIRLLDLFSGAGGASAGYAAAGFTVTGVDLAPMPRYPHTFHQADALDYLAAHGAEFDAIHASPPCQAYSTLRHRTGGEYVDLVDATRAALQATGKPYVIENVVGAPLINPVMLCGSMFGLRAAGRVLRRHRLFEATFPVTTPPDGCTGRPVGGVYGTGGAGQMTRGYKFQPDEAKTAMGIDWMSRAELSQAIPPAYTEHIGAYLLAAVTNAAL